MILIFEWLVGKNQEVKNDFVNIWRVILLKNPSIMLSQEPCVTTRSPLLRVYRSGLAHRSTILLSAPMQPSWGCVKLSDFLKLQGISISSPTIQKILIRNGLASVYDRWLKVEERHEK